MIKIAYDVSSIPGHWATPDVGWSAVCENGCCGLRRGWLGYAPPDKSSRDRHTIAHRGEPKDQLAIFECEGAAQFTGCINVEGSGNLVADDVRSLSQCDTYRNRPSSSAVSLDRRLYHLLGCAVRA